ncbi:MAG TPA: aldehyde dehydrogenase family protein [Terriglobales bacterium]|nr:aldehyde dehydrogenase family protein [Terriglobales bacterium]
MENQGFLLNGEWIRSGEPQVVRSPYDQNLVGGTFLATQLHLEAAIAGSAAAFEQSKNLPAPERQRILNQVSLKIAEHKEEFARLIALEAGKPIKAARTEVDRAVFTFSLAAEESVRINEERIAIDLQNASEKRVGIIRRFPVGPVSAITPFNFPLNLVAHKLAPAIACGCPVVLKPAPQTPLTALKLAGLIQEAGLPPGASQVLPMTNEDAAALVEDDRMKVLSFTGSASIGWQLKAKSGKKRVLLELGGNAAVIIHGDADIEHAAARCAFGGFTYAGQSCISVQRIFVQSKVFSAFLASLVEKVKKLKSGNPLNEETDVGPLIRESDAQRVEEWIDEAALQGATLMCGGERTGSFVEPAVLTGTKPSQRINSEEVFGPVVTVEPYEEFEEALQRANDSRYGLQAGVFTHEPSLIQQAFQRLEVGGVIANEVPTFRADHMPYGGVKDSGLGREGVRYAMEEMTDRKILVTRT